MGIPMVLALAAVLSLALPDAVAAGSSRAPSADQRPLIVTAGDSLAQGYGMALPAALDKESHRVENAGRVSTGLSFNKGFDWVERLGSLAMAKRPSVFILSFGANDAGMPTKGAPFGGPMWEALYSARVRAAVTAAASTGAAVVWMPVPRMGRLSLDAYCDKVREVQTVAARQAGAIVPDLKSVSDPSGRLRAKDGVHFTMEGYKVAALAGLSSAVSNVALAKAPIAKPAVARAVVAKAAIAKTAVARTVPARPVIVANNGRADKGADEGKRPSPIASAKQGKGSGLGRTALVGGSTSGGGVGGGNGGLWPDPYVPLKVADSSRRFAQDKSKGMENAAPDEPDTVTLISGGGVK